MNQWSWLIVPVTMFVLFVLSQLMKRDEQKQRQRRVEGPRREPAPEDDRSEMQKFLDEVQRLRDRAEQKKKEAATPWSAPQRIEPEVQTTAPQPRPVVRVASERRRPSVRITKPQPVLEVVAADDDEAAATVRKSEPVTMARPPASAAARQMLELLRSPQSLATAWILKEVFDRPLCMRRIVPRQ
jgi:hypothetical protein